jgi:hypothetical protein
MAVQSRSVESTVEDGGDASRPPISTQRTGGDDGVWGAVRIVLVLGGNTLTAVLAAAGELDLAVAVGIGLGLVFLVWLVDVSYGIRTGG